VQIGLSMDAKVSDGSMGLEGVSVSFAETARRARAIVSTSPAKIIME
jgi:hypothetical protein